MELAYEKLMREKGVTFEELPNDAKVGINAIKQIGHSIKMAEKRGHKISAAIAEKYRVNDKWVTREILDHCENKKTNSPEIPNDPAEVIKEIEGLGNQMSDEDKKKLDEGLKIEAELELLQKSGKTTFTTEELKTSAKTTYSNIFNGYEQGKENGVRTSKFELLEVQGTPQTFNLTIR